MPIVGVGLHDVPQDRPTSDGDHRLRAIFCFFAQTRTFSSAENDYFHGIILSGIVVLGSPGHTAARVNQGTSEATEIFATVFIVRRGNKK